MRQDVVADECLCGREIVLRPNHRMRRGQGTTPAAFYLGLCRLRGILSPPAPHDCAAGGPFLTAAAMTLRRSASLGLKSRIDAALALRRRSAGGPFYFAAAKIRIGCGPRSRYDRSRRNHSLLSQRKLVSDADVVVATPAAGGPFFFAATKNRIGRE